jgi:hypothetical protein
VSQVTDDGVPRDSYEYRGGYPMSLLPSATSWPNTWFGNLGLELTAPRTAWLLGRIGYGLQLEYTGTLHRLGARRPADSSLGTVTWGGLSLGLVTSW